MRPEDHCPVPSCVRPGMTARFCLCWWTTDAGLTGVEGSQSDQDAAVVANVRQLAPHYIGRNPLDLIGPGPAAHNDRTGRPFRGGKRHRAGALGPRRKLLDPVTNCSAAPAATGCAATRRWAPESPTAVRRGRPARRRAARRPGIPGSKWDRSAMTEQCAGPAGRERCAWVSQGRAGGGGAGLDVMVECYALDYPAALRVAAALEPYDCFWLEAVLGRSGGVGGQRYPAGGVRGTHEGPQPPGLIERQAVGVLQPDVKWTGGILEAKKSPGDLPACARPAQQLQPGGHRSSAHLSATLPNFLILETAHARLGGGPAARWAWWRTARCRERLQALPGLASSSTRRCATARAALNRRTRSLPALICSGAGRSIPLAKRPHRRAMRLDSLSSANDWHYNQLGVSSCSTVRFPREHTGKNG